MAIPGSRCTDHLLEQHVPPTEARTEAKGPEPWGAPFACVTPHPRDTVAPSLGAAAARRGHVSGTAPTVKVGFQGSASTRTDCWGAFTHSLICEGAEGAQGPGDCPSTPCSPAPHPSAGADGSGPSGARRSSGFLDSARPCSHVFPRLPSGHLG